MRTVFLAVLAVWLGSRSLAQVPNAGFESWSVDPDSNLNPVGWQTTNSHPITMVDRVSPGCTGNYALRVRSVDVGVVLHGVALLESGVRFSSAPKRFSACVKSTIMPGDCAYIFVALMKGDSVIASTDSCTFKIDSTISQFTYREFPLALLSTLIPDSLVIMVASGLGGGTAGTELIIDDVAFTEGGVTEVGAPAARPLATLLLQNYPNPFNPTTTFRFRVPSPGLVSLSVLDLLGRDVATVVHEVLPSGEHSKIWTAGGLSSGIYYYRLRAAGSVATGRLVLLR